jgi:hypothetical protein
MVKTDINGTTRFLEDLAEPANKRLYIIVTQNPCEMWPRKGDWVQRPIVENEVVSFF